MGADDFDHILRLLAAAAVGIALGFNRELRDKPLGMRTLALVAVGSAVAALAAINFRDVASKPNSLARVIQGVVEGVLAGIGFIGVGAVLDHARSETVYGLTTAALGIACALGAWTLVVSGLVLALAILFGLNWLEQHLFTSR